MVAADDRASAGRVVFDKAAQPFRIASRPFAWILHIIGTVLKWVFVVAAIFIILGLFFGGYETSKGLTDSGQAGSLVKHTEVAVSEPIGGVKGAVVKYFPTLSSIFSGNFQQQLSFESEVEANANNPDLGVKIRNFEALPSTITEGDKIIFSGNIKFVTLSEPISIQAFCSLEDYKNNALIPAALFGSTTTKVNQATIYPFSNEELNVECLFPEGVPVAKNKVTKIAKLIIAYDYATEASQTVYFMPQEEFLAIERKGLNPFEVKKIRNPQLRSDRKIVSKSIDGPMKLTVGVDLPQPFVGNRPYKLQAQLTNNLGWIGNIKRINELSLQVPHVQDLTLCLEGTSCYPSASSVDTCDFEYVGPGDEGFDIYNVKQSVLDSVNRDCSSDTIRTAALTEKQCIDLFRSRPTFSCSFVALNVPDNLQYDSIRAKARYIYKAEKQSYIDIIKANPEVFESDISKLSKAIS